MKKLPFSLLTIVLSYTYLFFEQHAGVNFFLFTVVLAALLLVNNPVLLKSRGWLSAAAASLFSGLCIVGLHSGLAVVAHLLSVVVMVGYSFQSEASLLVAVAQAGWSIISAWPLELSRRVETKTGIGSIGGVKVQKLYTYAVPAVVTLVFFLLYKSANPIFDRLVNGLEIRFLSWPLIWFAFTGVLLFFGVFYSHTLPSLTLFDLYAKDELTRQRRTERATFNAIALKLENYKGLVLLWLLNALLFIVNLNDVVYLLMGQPLPAGSSHAENVHQGVYTLILTVLLAMGIVLYYFRGNQHFYAKNQKLRLLAYVWIAQNILLLLITTSKNGLYIQDYGLTYKRIGVYVYLLLTLIGLVTTLIKVSKIKSAWFLVRKNSWAFYTVLVVSAAINWDSWIATYNLEFAKVKDISYLLSLSNSVLPQLNAISHDPAVSESQKVAIEQWKVRLKQRVATQEWQSWNYEDYRILSEIGAGK